MMEKTKRGRGRPRNPEKRIALLSAARGLFLRNGADGVTVEQVIGDAGVSRATYYRYFKDQDDLLAAVIGRESERIVTDDAAASFRDLPLREALIGYGEGFMRFLAHPDTVRLEPLILHMRDNRPNLGLAFYEAGPRRVWDILKVILGAGISRGELEQSLDLDQAVSDLIGLWRGSWYTQVMYGTRRLPTKAEQQRRVRHAVDLYLRASGACSRS